MELDKIKIANIIADAMVEKIKEKNLMKEFAETIGDDFDGFGKLVITVFAMKIAPNLIALAEQEESEDFDDEDIEMIKTFKSIFNMKGEQND